MNKINLNALHEKYPIKRSSTLINFAIRSEIQGGQELLELLEFTQKRLHSGELAEEAQNHLEDIHEALNRIKGRFLQELEIRYPEDIEASHQEQQKAAREEAGITQKELAHLLDLSLRTVSKREQTGSDMRTPSKIESETILSRLLILRNHPEIMEKIKKIAKKS